MADDDENTIDVEVVDTDCNESRTWLDLSNRRGFLGGLFSWGNQKAAKRVESEFRAKEQAVRALSDYADAQVDFEVAVSRLQEKNLKTTIKTETKKIQEQHERADITLRETKAHASRIDKQSELADLELDTDIEEAKLRNKRAKEAASRPPPDPEKTAAEQKSALNIQIQDLDEKMARIERELADKKADGSLDKAAETEFQRKYNNLNERREKLLNELDSL